MQNKARSHGRRPVAFLLLLVFLLSLLSACAAPGETGETGETTEAAGQKETTGPKETEIPDETRPENELWIVTDEANSDFYELAIRSFRQDHPDITFNLEAIPIDPAEQEAYLQNLRVQIMAGKGPDIYLLGQFSPLFLDVEQSMRNGLFTDISGFYDADAELNKDGFVTAVMESGVVDGARYVLPLRYDIPLLYVNMDLLETAGMELDDLGTGFSGLEDVTRALGSDAVVSEITLGYYLLNFFPEVFDYEADNVILPEEDLADFLATYQSLASAGNSFYSFISYLNYIRSDSYWAKPNTLLYGDGFGGTQEIQKESGCVCIGSVFSLAQNLRLAKASDTELAVRPIRAADGSLIASVTAYGAVGAGCQDPELAYSFLRTLLLEENQWRTRAESSYLYFSSWPVLAEGAWEPLDKGLWDADAKNDYEKEGAVEGHKERKAALAAVELTEEDFSVLDEEISKAVYPAASVAETANKISTQLDPFYNPDAVNTDPQKLARELLQDLSWHLAEG